MDTRHVLIQFNDTRLKSLRKYHKFMREGVGQGQLKELTGGGHIRSQGGWSQMLTMRRGGQKEEFDERILGGGDFVNSILKEARDRYLRYFKVKRSGETIEKLIEEECRKQSISLWELKGDSKRWKVSDTRAVVALWGRHGLSLSAAEIARQVGVNTSGVTKAIERAVQRYSYKYQKQKQRP